jgi:hypothetical protein
MDETPQDDRSSTPKTPEQIRAERIAAVADPKLRLELEGLVKTRDSQLAELRDKQKENFDSRVTELRQQKINSANAPQLAPAGMRPAPYLGTEGQARAQREAELDVKKLDLAHLKQIAKEHNDHIDKRLDAQHENQITREPPRVQAAESQRGPAPRSQGPNRYAELIQRQNYTERAKQAEADRGRDLDPTRKPPRGPER